MATDLNSVVVIGRLTRDAEVSYFQSGSAVARMSIAVNRSRKENEQWISEVNYFDVSLFGKQAETLKQYLLKGKQIAVQGALRQDRWEKDGQKFSKVYIVANNIELLGGSRSDGGSSYNQGSYGSSSNSASSYVPRQSAEPEGSFGGDMDNFSEDIPF